MTTQINDIQVVNQKITLGLFGFLFLIRLVEGYLQAITQGNSYPFFVYIYINGSLIFTTIIIWRNKANANELNLDKFFIYIFILTGILLFLSFGLSFIGMVAILCVVLTVRTFFIKRFALNNSRNNYRTIIVFILLGTVPVIVLKLLVRELSTYLNPYMALSASEIFMIVAVILWGVIIEEILFRGALWMLLTKWNFSNKKIVITQAFMFWLVHLNYISGASFGIVIFLIGLWFGFLVLRSKSLVPSTITHFVWNVMSDL
jgi:membrane protease YdiL (CAAX protease family)